MVKVTGWWNSLNVEERGDSRWKWGPTDTPHNTNASGRLSGSKRRSWAAVLSHLTWTFQRSHNPLNVKDFCQTWLTRGQEWDSCSAHTWPTCDKFLLSISATPAAYSNLQHARSDLFIASPDHYLMEDTQDDRSASSPSRPSYTSHGNAAFPLPLLFLPLH